MVAVVVNEIATTLAERLVCIWEGIHGPDKVLLRALLVVVKWFRAQKGGSQNSGVAVLATTSFGSPVRNVNIVQKFTRRVAWYLHMLGIKIDSTDFIASWF